MMSTDIESKILDDLKPFYFAVTMRGEWLYCQMPDSGHRKGLERVSTYISTYQLNSVFVNASRESPEVVLGRMPPKERERRKAENKVPKPGDCPLIRWELTACINDAAAISSDSSGMATVTLAAAGTLEQILGEQDRLLTMLDDSKKDKEILPPSVSVVPRTAADATLEVTPEQFQSTGLFGMNDSARKSAADQLKAMIDGRADGQDPMLEFNPLDLLLKKSNGIDGKST